MGSGVRRTIAVLTDYLDHLAGGYETELRRGFEHACKARDLNLLLVVGRSLGDTPHDRVYDLVRKKCADGLVLMTAGLSLHRGLAAVERLGKASGLPLCSIGERLPGVPSIVIDNRSGLAQTIDHLIDDHSKKRIFFLGGPDHNTDARSRLEVYREALSRHAIPFDPELVAFGDFTLGSGTTVMREALARGVAFDAVVAANDGMGLGAIHALRERGIRIPDQVALTGFDDLVLSRFADPPLTTVRQPIERMAALSIDILVKQMAGATVAEVTELPVEVVRRRSCGCGSIAEQKLATRPAATSEGISSFIDEHASRLRERLTSVLHLPAPRDDEVAGSLVEALRAELSGEKGAFGRALERAVRGSPDRIELHEELQTAVTVLRCDIPAGSPALEELWHDARCLISAGHARSQAELRLSIERSYWNALQSGERLSTAFDWPSLKAALADELPQVVQSAFVSLQAPGGEPTLEPFFCLLDGRPCEAEVERFSADSLFPPVGGIAKQRRTLYALPLVSETDLLGIAVLEAHPGSGTHEMLREQLEFAVKNVALHRELVEKTALHERSVQERIATAKRMNALSVLAGGVAHDLNNALAPLVALPQVMLKQLDAIKAGGNDREFKEDLATIHMSALRAAQTIKDLLALGRQGRGHREPLELNRVVQNALLNEEFYIEGAAASGIELELDLDKDALPIQGSETQIARAISNLLRNAVEAIAGKGTVRVRTWRAVLEQPLLAYEAVEAGTYACVSVSDSGRGIADADRDSIFEPFFSKKRLSEHSGSGLGLAIVHGVVKDHSGFVNVESTPGAGATFTLYFPTAQERPRAGLTIPPASRGEARILLVDDDPTQLRTASRVLAPIGYDVVATDNGVAAYGHFAEASIGPGGRSPFDLVIIDMQLSDPDDGLAVFERIRALFPSQKGLVVSGHAPTERAERALDAGLTWLAKPYAADDLVRAVQGALR
jgi:DNA-binding LacI/PurR family transcriptional regulator/signal transduction histidine kinase/ActR/RegA family two-component response regulator